MGLKSPKFHFLPFLWAQKFIAYTNIQIHVTHSIFIIFLKMLVTMSSIRINNNWNYQQTIILVLWSPYCVNVWSTYLTNLKILCTAQTRSVRALFATTQQLYSRDIFLNLKILPLDKLINQQEIILAYKVITLAWWHTHWQTWIRSLPTWKLWKCKNSTALNDTQSIIYLYGPLNHIFNKSTEAGIIPADWQSANVTAIHQETDRNL